MSASLVGSEMCIRDRILTHVFNLALITAGASDKNVVRKHTHDGRSNLALASRKTVDPRSRDE
eukprot:3507143-Alexandrium_andersonii.AAC.1